MSSALPLVMLATTLTFLEVCLSIDSIGHFTVNYTENLQHQVKGLLSNHNLRVYSQQQLHLDSLRFLGTTHSYPPCHSWLVSCIQSPSTTIHPIYIEKLLNLLGSNFHTLTCHSKSKPRGDTQEDTQLGETPGPRETQFQHGTHSLKYTIFISTKAFPNVVANPSNTYAWLHGKIIINYHHLINITTFTSSNDAHIIIKKSTNTIQDIII